VQGKLVDEEGFPIGDVAKIISVREARNKLARLQTDYRELMKNIESGLSQLHQNSANKQHSDVVGRPSTPATSSDSVRESFAEVDEVLEGSPAEEAQLRVKDEIVFWGSVNKDSVNRFQAIAELTSTSEGRPISVGVVRSGSVHMLVLVPKKMEGSWLARVPSNSSRQELEIYCTTDTKTRTKQNSIEDPMNCVLRILHLLCHPH